MREAGEYSQLARSLFHWLNYHSSVSRSDILLESAIRFPLTEFIERRCQVPVQLESKHPEFDRLRIDFVYTVSNQKRNIEVKFLHDYSDRDAEFKRYFDDLVRLALLEGFNYFILCGSLGLFHSKIMKSLVQISKDTIPLHDEARPVKDNQFSTILPFGDVGAELQFAPFELFTYIGQKPFVRDIPKHLKTVHVQLTAKADNQDEGSQVVYIWRVKRT